MALFL
jgi:hypothetical protein